MMAPDKSLATLPISAMVLGIWAGTLPLGFLAKRYRPPHRLRERRRPAARSPA